MRLDKKEMVQLLRIISILLQEACWDFSNSANLAVLNVNGRSMVLNKSELSLLNKVKNDLEGDLKW